MISEALDIVELGAAEDLIQMGVGDTEEIVEKFVLTSAFYVELSEG